jgi:hypothetical protein
MLRKLITCMLVLSISGCSFLFSKKVDPIEIKHIDKSYLLDYCKEPIPPKIYFNINKDSNINIKNLLTYINYLYNNNSICYKSLTQSILSDKI